MIKCLPNDVQAKLRSGVAVPSLQQCVEELILNSIDAEATCVGVRMDMEAFRVQVIDNGVGMSAEDMGRVGNRYHTSKCSSVQDLDDLSWYGFRGEALASIASLATLVEISSRTRSSVKTLSKIFKDCKGVDVFEAETSRPSAGTTVTICNFFHNMPVRRKRVNAVLEGERIRHRVEAISLMHPSVSFTLKNDVTGAMMVQLPKARSTYHRFAQIHGLGRAQRLGEINHAHAQFEVIGYVGREGHYNNSLQFLYVNERLLVKTRLHKLLNLLLRRPSGFHSKLASPELHPATRSPKHKRSQDLNGVYVINIKCSYSEYDICLEPAKSLVEFRDWDGILLCIEEAVKAFVGRENVEALISQDDLDHVSPKSFGIRSTDTEGHNGGGCGQGTRSASTLDCSIGMTLASHPVHRRREDTHASEDGVCQESGIMERQEETEQNEMPELEKTTSEESMNEDCSDEPLCDLAGMEPATDNNYEEEGTPLRKAEEDSKRSCISSSGENLECSKERERIFNNTASASGVTSPDTRQIHPGSNCIEQTLPDDHGTGHKQAAVSNRKIGLSDPYVHDSLQTTEPLQIYKQPILARKSEERHFASKRKISLDSGQDRPCQELCKDLASVVPSKMPRIPACPKVSLCKGFGSLERFRRKYGKSDELKAPSQVSQQECNTTPQTDRFVSNSQNFLSFRKEQRGHDLTDPEKTRGGLQSPPALAIFTGLKPVSAQDKGPRSLAAKLSHFKQHGTDYKALPHLSRTITQHNAGLRGSDNGSPDNRNNKDDCETALNQQAVPACGTNPQLVEREECTASGDWLHHYDTSVGKTVYINRVTGLSRYEDLPVEDTQVRCTSDVTNMAVSVVSGMGELELPLCSSA